MGAESEGERQMGGKQAGRQAGRQTDRDTERYPTILNPQVAGINAIPINTIHNRYMNRVMKVFCTR